MHVVELKGELVVHLLEEEGLAGVEPAGLRPQAAVHLQPAHLPLCRRGAAGRKGKNRFRAELRAGGRGEELFILILVLLFLAVAGAAAALGELPSRARYGHRSTEATFREGN